MGLESESLCDRNRECVCVCGPTADSAERLTEETYLGVCYVGSHLVRITSVNPACLNLGTS